MLRERRTPESASRKQVFSLRQSQMCLLIARLHAARSLLHSSERIRIEILRHRFCHDRTKVRGAK